MVTGCSPFVNHFLEHLFDFLHVWGYNESINGERRDGPMDRVIFHCDLNSFYASVELLDHPELRHLPVAVCGAPASRHGIILAKNEPAKAFGIKTAETIWQARKKCPRLVLLPAHHDKYREFSRQVNQLYQEYTDLVEPFGIDESWLDVTGSLHLFGGDPLALAHQLRRRVRGELGLTISVGVSFNKVFAKLGSDYKKPDAVTLISPDNFRALVWPLPVTDLLYVGRAAADTLKRFGVRTIGGNGLTFPRSLSGREEICSGIAMLSDRVAVRLRRAGMKAAGVSLAIRDPDFRDISRQRRLEPPTCLARELSQAAVSLAEGCWNMDSPVRALTVTALYLISEDQAGVQLDLLGQADAPRRDRLERLDRTLDQIRAKYGRNAISPASSAGVCQGGVQEEDEEGATS